MNASEMATPHKPAQSPSSISPNSSSSTSLVETPEAADPSPRSSFPQHHKVYLEGIPEQLGKQARQPPQHVLDNQSYDSLLTSLEEEDQLSLADEESFYFTPLEEAPVHRLDRVKRELKVRAELLDYVSQELPQAQQEELRAQEQVSCCSIWFALWCPSIRSRNTLVVPFGTIGKKA
jgi:hypothetical protein